MKSNLQSINSYQERLADDLYLPLLAVEGGTYKMGQEEEEEGHEITLSDFHIGQYPITTAQYLLFVNETNTHFPEWLEEGSQYHIYQGTSDFYKRLGEALTHPLHPIVGVSWHDAVAFCEWLSEKTKKNYRLPSESEWEYAARGGKYSEDFPYSGSHKVKEVAWYGLNSNGESKQVGLKHPNELGIYDMSGNVWEWCQDHWQGDLKQIPQDGSPWLNVEKKASTEADRVVRGGSWFFTVDFCRVSYRNFFLAKYRSSDLGFRVVRY